MLWQPTMRRMLESPTYRLVSTICLLVVALSGLGSALATDIPASAEALLAARIAVPTEQTSDHRSRLLLETGIRYENGENVDQDFQRAHHFYCQAAGDNQPDALIRLGWLYANGSGVNRNDLIAATLFRRAANLGHDLGGQLAVLFNAVSQQLPECLGGPGDDLSAETTPSATGHPAELMARSLAPTPTIDAPAQFRESALPIEHRKVVNSVLRMAGQFRLDPRLVLAVIGTESGFDPNAKSSKNALGLMQLIPDTAERFAVKDVLDPIQNLRGGMSYLRWLLSYYRGDVVLAVAAYNAGEGSVDKFKGVPPYAETLAYVQRIRTLYPFDFHPFDPIATAPSAMLRVGNAAVTPPTGNRPPRM